MYLWIGLGIEEKTEQEIRKYCREVNKNYDVNEQSFTLPQHISLKISFNTDNYKKIIEDLKIKFSNNKKLNLNVEKVDSVPGVIWLVIKETLDLRNYHNKILKYLESKYAISKIGFDGDTFKFHSTLFQDEDNKELVKKLYNNIDKNIFENRELTVNRIYFGVSEIGKVGTYKVIDSLELK
mgnify:CR=1 FL=1